MTEASGRRRAARASSSSTAAAQRPVAVLIVGAGFSGLCMAIRLRQAGIHDLAILERAHEVGGTWRDNTYPGAACDVPSNLYSYSFAPNPDWSRSFSGCDEIQAYTRELVRRYELRPLIRFGHEVTGLQFDAEQGVWNVAVEGRGTIHARTVVMAPGPLSTPSYPDIPGIDSFGGQRIHSGAWDHGYDFHGKRVAVIGTGASAVQIVPELVKVVGRLKVFQRTPGWVLPRLDYRTPDWSRALFRRIPLAQRAVRESLFWAYESSALGVIWHTPLTRVMEELSLRHLRSQVSDPWMRRQLTPDFRIGCKRVLLSSDFYPALQRPNCELITWPIACISPGGIRTADGLEHRVDGIVFATGFEVAKTGAPIPIGGLDGRQLGQDWSRGSYAYKSTSIAGYPNLFMLPGPNSGPGHNSFLVYMEAQAGYVLQGVQAALREGVRFVDVREEVQRRFNQRIQQRLQKTNWNSGCKSWYITEDGFNPSMYPGFATQFRRQMREFSLDDYRVVEAA
ncbi:MAG: NAD(P)/FAD-dependent oxidoreductase [Nevskia sp.]|nr:NAD(P)/FAD-dependent oxidoreductase [Nevskia sp.]